MPLSFFVSTKLLPVLRGNRCCEFIDLDATALKVQFAVEFITLAGIAQPCMDCNVLLKLVLEGGVLEAFSGSR